MAENSAARLAAGRDLLKSFQAKKKESDKLDTSIRHNNDNVQSNAYPGNVNPTNIPNQSSSSKENQNHKTTTENRNTHPENNYLKNKIRNLPNSNSVDFFDQVQSSNSIQRTQNIINNDNGITSAENLPMAGVLFGNQTDRTSGDFHAHNNDIPHGQKIPDSPKSDSISPGQNENCTNTQKSLVNNIVDSETDLKSSVEISRLQQQLQFAQKSVEFLVSEKNEMTTTISNLEKSIVTMKTQIEDISGRLNISRHRASHLEMECSNLKQKNKEVELQYSEALKEVSKHKSTQSTCDSRTKELEEEILEMKSLMNHKVLENKNLLKIVEDMTFQINTNELKLQQLTQGSVQTVNADDQTFRVQYQSMQDQVNNLKHQVDELEYEKKQSNSEYQQYVQQLNNQVSFLNEKQYELTTENESLISREANLVQHVDELQSKLQAQMANSNPPDSKPIQSSDSFLKENFDKLQVEYNDLKEELNKRESDIRTAEQELQISRNKIDELTNSIHILQTDRPDAAKLNAANESDRLAAQKATAQNAKMKIHLQELEEAFGKMTNSKLEMAELLQAEKNLTKMLSLKLAENEEKLKEIQVKVIAKDEEMIRLQALSSDQDMELQKQNKLLEQAVQFEADDESPNTLRAELDSARNQLALLIDENKNLRRVQNGGVHNEVETNDSSIIENQDHDSIKQKDQVNRMPSTEAMEKLQNRFTKLMKEVADLSDEKQGLEHLVLQLQGETETICEYIALYQKQRNILKQRENEKNLQLSLLDKERQHMKDKIEQVNELIQQLVIGNSKPKEVDHLQMSGKVNSELQTETSLTAEKIMGLLTEIKSSHLIEPSETCTGLENFNPCPWCSGKLINV